MTKRKSIPQQIETELLVQSGRRCCLCFGLDRDLAEKRGQIAHLDDDPSNNHLDNLAYLCFRHHDQYDSSTRQSKGLTIEEVKRYRHLLYAALEADAAAPAPGTTSVTHARRPLYALKEPTAMPGRTINEQEPIMVYSPPRQVGRWWPIILVVIGLALLAPRILNLEEEPVWLSVLSDTFGLLSTIIGFALFALMNRERSQIQMMMLKQASPKKPEFPFHVVFSIAEVTDILLPNPAGSIPIADRQVPYIPRDIPELQCAFAETGRVLLRGRSKAGKTRAIIELLRGYWRTAPTVLVFKRAAELQVPTSIPDDLPRRNLVIVIDDLHTKALACKKQKTTVGAVISDMLASFVQHCGNQLSEVRLIVTVRREPECWEQIAYIPTKLPWSQIKLVDLPNLSTDEARRLAVELAGMPPSLKLEPEVADAIAKANDGTFYHLILAFRDWRRLPDKKEVTVQDTDDLQADLASAWRHRRSNLFQHKPRLKYVYAALDLAQALEIPARQDLLSILVQSLRSGLLVRIYGWAVLFQRWLRTKVLALICQRWFLLARALNIRVMAKALATLHNILSWPFRSLLNVSRVNERWPRVWPWISHAVLDLASVLLGTVLSMPFIIIASIIMARVETAWLLVLQIVAGALLLNSEWILRLLLSQSRRSFDQDVAYVSATEMPVAEGILVPYDLQVEGIIKEYATQPWVSELIQGRYLTSGNSALYGLLLHWTYKPGLGAIGWEVGVCVGEVLTRLDSKDAEAYGVRGIAYRNLGDCERAIADYDRAIELEPRYANAYHNRGVAYSYLEDYERAIADYDRAIELNPESADGYNSRGVAYSYLEDYERAIADYDRAIELNPEDINAHFNKACAYALMNKVQQACDWLQKAITLDPKYRQMAQTDTDFDPIRHTSAFQALVRESQEDN